MYLHFRCEILRWCLCISGVRCSGDVCVPGVRYSGDVCVSGARYSGDVCMFQVWDTQVMFVCFRCWRMPRWCCSGWNTEVRVAVTTTVGMGPECWLESHTSFTPGFCSKCFRLVTHSFIRSLTQSLSHSVIDWLMNYCFVPLCLFTHITDTLDRIIGLSK